MRIDFKDDDCPGNLHVRHHRDDEGRMNYEIPVEDPEWYCAGIVIRNSSNAPITDVRVHSSGYVMHNGKRTNRIEKKPRMVQALLTLGEYICLEVNDINNPNKYKDGWTYSELAGTYLAKVRPILNNKKWKVKSITFTDATAAAGNVPISGIS